MPVGKQTIREKVSTGTGISTGTGKTNLRLYISMAGPGFERNRTQQNRLVCLAPSSKIGINAGSSESKNWEQKIHVLVLASLQVGKRKTKSLQKLAIRIIDLPDDSEGNKHWYGLDSLPGSLDITMVAKLKVKVDKIRYPTLESMYIVHMLTSTRPGLATLSCPSL